MSYLNYNGSFDGTIMSPQEVTRKKFGQPGVDAITNYPFLVKAQIDSDYYMQEEGTARPATSFSIKKISDDSVVAEAVSGRAPVKLAGKVIYKPAGGGLPLPLILGGLAVIGVTAIFLMRR